MVDQSIAVPEALPLPALPVLAEPSPLTVEPAQVPEEEAAEPLPKSGTHA
jgi:hypothetical protein